MKKLFLKISTLLLVSSFALGSSAYAKSKVENCTFNGIPLYGKVKIVDHFEDIKVKVVDNFEDIKVKRVDHFPNSCGKWQFVDHFEDFKVKFVDHFEDVKIKLQ